MSAQARTPQGVPAGGQFAASMHAEAGTELADPDSMTGLDPDQQTEVQDAYAAAATFSSMASDDAGDPVELDGFELSDEARASLDRQARKAWNGMPDDLRQAVLDNDSDLGQWGHDMWLTREGHGTGYWDRSDDTYGVGVGDKLAAYARTVGEGGMFYIDDDKISFDAL